MAYTTFNGETRQDYVFGRDGSYHPVGQGPKLAKDGERAPRTLKRELRRGGVCEDCKLERSTGGQCGCDR